MIDAAQSDRLFRAFVADKSIPFKHPQDGCFARASAMAKIAEGQSVSMGKIYVEGALQIENDDPAARLVQWGFHVAPLAYVKSKDGDSRLMIFDPSLFDHPVPVNEWKNRMLDTTNNYNSHINETYYGSRFQYFMRKEPNLEKPFEEDRKTAWAQSDFTGGKYSVESVFKIDGPLQFFPPTTASRSAPNAPAGARASQ